MPDDQRSMLPLDLIGIREATDKSSLVGDYLRHYEALFAGMRDDNFNFLEIGVFRGGSARMWANFFSRARIIGVDIDPGCRAYASDRIAIEIGSQNDPAFLHYLASTYSPRVIIDDGSHQSYDVIFTFERLFPALAAGGVYVIEDLHFHLLPHEAERLRGGSPVLAHEYVVDLVRDRLGSTAYVEQLTGLRRYLVSAIDRIEIVSQAAVIHKKADEDVAGALAKIRPFVEASNDWNNWLNFSQKMHRATGNDRSVIEALRRAIAADPQPIVTYHRLSEALERTGDIDGAIETVNQAIIVARHDIDVVTELRTRLNRLQEMKPTASVGQTL